MGTICCVKNVGLKRPRRVFAAHRAEGPSICIAWGKVTMSLRVGMSPQVFASGSRSVEPMSVTGCTVCRDLSDGSLQPDVERQNSGLGYRINDQTANLGQLPF